MPAKRNRTFSHAFDLARLGAEAWMVIGLRVGKLAAGGPAAMLEAHRMVAEKSLAAVEAQFTAGLALAAGASHDTVCSKTIAGYRRRVAANRRRLARKR